VEKAAAGNPGGAPRLLHKLKGGSKAMGIYANKTSIPGLGREVSGEEIGFEFYELM
jgi:hypothetical protein